MHQSSLFIAAVYIIMKNNGYKNKGAQPISLQGNKNSINANGDKCKITSLGFILERNHEQI